METKKMKRSTWIDDEVKHLIEIIKEKEIMKLLDGKTKRNKTVFEMIAKEMEEKGYKKNVGQIRDKFKNLKKDYYKIKRNNSKSGNQRHSSQYFHLLDDILGHRPCASTVGVDTSLEDSMNELLMDFPMPEIEIQMREEMSSHAQETTSELTLTSEPPTTPESTPNLTKTDLTTTPKSSMRTFKHTKKNSYQKVVSQFTEEWKNTQQDMMNMMKAQDEKFLQSMDMQIEREREILKEHRLETAKMMEKDRNEVMGMFDALLTKVQHQSPMPQYPTFLPMHNLATHSNVIFNRNTAPVATFNSTTTAAAPEALETLKDTFTSFEFNK